jgi:hypothetical protein
MSDRRVLAAFLVAIGGAVYSCVWVNGSPQLAAPAVEDRVVWAPAMPLPSIAWTTHAPPTRDQSARLEALRAEAKEHRLASEALRSVEASACSGLADDDRDVSPFFHVDDIVDVQPLRGHGRGDPGHLEGAVVTFRSVEGLTPARLQGLIDCQIARDAALAFAAPETSWCPLAVRGVRVRVVRHDRGLDVELSSADADAAVETYSRALALLATR